MAKLFNYGNYVYTIMTNDSRIYGKVVFSSESGTDVFWQSRTVSTHENDKLDISLYPAEVCISDQEKRDLDIAIKEWATS